jgi:glycosyltransferase involved in cell wall biosynthesis
MRKILAIVTTPFYQEKGSSFRVCSIVLNLAKRYEVDLVTYSLGQNIKIQNMNIMRTTKLFKPKLTVSKPTVSKILLDICVLVKAFKLKLKNKYSIIHCEDFEGAFIGYCLSLFFRKTKFVYDLHNMVIDNIRISSHRAKGKLFEKVISLIEKRVIKNFDLIIINWEKYLSEPLFKDKNKFIYFDKHELDTEKYDIDANKDYIVYAGNFEPYQGIQEFLETFKKVNANYNLVLIGKPSQTISAFINDNKLNNRVFLTGTLNIRQCNYLIQNSLLGISPRKSGKQPSMKLISYLVMEKPVLASDVEANSELLISGYNSYKYRSNKELEDFLQKISKNKNILNKYKQGVRKTRERLLNNWSYNNFIDQYEEIAKS